MVAIGLIALVFIAFIPLAVVPAGQFTGKLGHLVTELRRILITAALIELFSHCKPSFFGVQLSFHNRQGAICMEKMNNSLRMRAVSSCLFLNPAKIIN
jgi:hypothetical protein